MTFQSMFLLLIILLVGFQALAEQRDESLAHQIVEIQSAPRELRLLVR